jgi:hypothetical protein
MHFGIDAHLIKQGELPQRTVKFPGQYRLKVDHSLRLVVKPHAQGVGRHDLEGSDAMDRMWPHLPAARGSIGKGASRAQSANNSSC